MNIAILDDYFNRAVNHADWAAADFAEFTFFDRHEADLDVLAEQLAPFDGIGVMRERTPMPRALLERLPNLKVLVTTGKQNASIDLDAARELGITVCGTESPGHATSELAFMLTLMLLRQVHAPIQDLKGGGGWQTHIGQDARGKTLGLLGLGRLGGQMAMLGQAIGMNTVAWSQNLTQARCDELGVEYVSKQDLFERSNVVSVHLRLSERSRHSVGEVELSLLGAGNYLVNTSRAEIVDTQALLWALNNQVIAGAGLDVYSVEPAGLEDPLIAHPKTLCTPHLGYCTQETYDVFYRQTLEAFDAFAKGSPIRVIA